VEFYPGGLILASTSSYRRSLLARLQVPFHCEAPTVDETPAAGESGAALASRLALAKAQEVAARFPRALVVGSDQVAACGDRLLGKPMDHARATGQLQSCSGETVTFYTALALACQSRALLAEHVDVVRVRFRSLSDAQIERYLLREKPYDCAGSFKCEGLGIALFERIDSHDPTALEGLPLIALTGLLREAGVDVLGGNIT
jgi:septum formation protein